MALAACKQRSTTWPGPGRRRVRHGPLAGLAGRTQAQEKLHKLYRKLDICVVPSLWPEPFGIVALEGMACGRPVIATRVGGLQEIVVDEETGCLVDPGNVEQFADRLERLMDDPDLRAKMGEKGRARVLADFTWDQIVKKHYLPLME